MALKKFFDEFHCWKMIPQGNTWAQKMKMNQQKNI